MNNGFRIDTEINRLHTLKQTKQAALNALQEYDAEWNSIHFIQVSEHVTFRIESGEGEKFLLRIHPESKSQEETLSELEWLVALRRKGLVVPEAVLNREGVFVTDTATSGGHRYYATLLKWVEGERLDKKALTEMSIRKMGTLLANLHEASADFCPNIGFMRPSWGSVSFQRDWEHLQRFHCHFISDEAFELYTMAVAKVANHLDTFEPNEANYGIIHADLHNGNIVFRDDEPYAIDFGRCGFGYHLYDMAQSIMGLLPLQRALFIGGYEQVRKMEDDAIPILESFFRHDWRAVYVPTT
ncbi:aminoglycoside phosphotransferase [Paenibacillus psychroresistens]|uniref:Aminoglycoside phosphotransferase n=1 Tax=Paenibacillus psychroresistens TaxID=1778678 RepID=A0A6B8RVM7_9BACL|nr:phosphotransferase [Paenibacillus psychroresistens]QGQ99188.1 aminoglycoside phosphotransferase [Paenibacillus psychroresistens]